MASVTTTRLCHCLAKSSYRQCGNEWVWQCSNKTLFRVTGKKIKKQSMQKLDWESAFSQIYTTEKEIIITFWRMSILLDKTFIKGHFNLDKAPPKHEKQWNIFTHGSEELMLWKCLYYCENVHTTHTTQSHLQIRCNTYQNTTGIFHINRKHNLQIWMQKILLFTKKTVKSQKQSWERTMLQVSHFVFQSISPN